MQGKEGLGRHSPVPNVQSMPIVDEGQVCLGLVPHSPQPQDSDENPEQRLSDNREGGELSKGKGGPLKKSQLVATGTAYLPPPPGSSEGRGETPDTQRIAYSSLAQAGVPKSQY